MKKSTIKEYQFTEHYLKRSPIFKQRDIKDVNALRAYINTRKFKNALFVSSPNLYKRIYDEDATTANNTYSDKEIVTLLNYAKRASNKAIPFGLFAGVSVKKWGEVKHDECLKIYARLDSRVYLELINKLEQDNTIKHHLSYFLNNTIVRKNEAYYLIDNTGLHKGKTPEEIQLDASEHLDKIINYLDTPKQYIDIVKLLAGEDAQLQKFAMEYLDKLIASRVILSELTPTILDDFSIQTIIEKISGLNEKGSKPILTNLKQIDAILHEFKNIDNDYSILNKQLETILAKFDIKDCKHSLIQIDSRFQRSESEVDLNKNIQYTLKEAIAVQHLIRERFLSIRKNFLSQLKRKVERRFGNELVPLSTLFNSKYGSDYIFHNQVLSPPFSNLKISNKGQPPNSGNIFTDSKFQSFLRDLYKKNIGNTIIDLSKEIDYKGALKKKHKLPYSICVHGSAIADGGFQVKSICFHGSKLINRFSFCDSEVKKLVQNLAKNEENTARIENIDLTEIDFVTTASMSNISQRTKTYDNILSVLTASGDGQCETIKLSNIGVRLDYYTYDFILCNLKNNRRILPIINCAIMPEHINYQVIKFLYYLTFSYYDFEFRIIWEPIQKEYDYFPRLVFKGIVFQRQTWILRKSDISTIMASNDDTIKDFLRSKGIPNRFSIDKGGDDVFFDINEYFSIHRLKSTIKRKKEVIINEQLIGNQNVSEVVLPMIKKINP